MKTPTEKNKASSYVNRKGKKKKAINTFQYISRETVFLSNTEDTGIPLGHLRGLTMNYNSWAGGQ